MTTCGGPPLDGVVSLAPPHATRTAAAHHACRFMFPPSAEAAHEEGRSQRARLRGVSTHETARTRAIGPKAPMCARHSNGRQVQPYYARAAHGEETPALPSMPPGVVP